MYWCCKIGDNLIMNDDCMSDGYASVQVNRQAREYLLEG